MDGNGIDLFLFACMVFIQIVKFLPPKARLVVGSMVAGALIGFAFLTAREPDFDVVLEQAKVVVPILSLFIFLVVYFGWRRYQKQQEEQLNRDQFNLAKTLIEGHHYVHARIVLGYINDPKARDWETKLRRRIPDNPDFLEQFQ